MWGLWKRGMDCVQCLFCIPQHWNLICMVAQSMCSPFSVSLGLSEKSSTLCCWWDTSANSSLCVGYTAPINPNSHMPAKRELHLVCYLLRLRWNYLYQGGFRGGGHPPPPPPPQGFDSTPC